MAVGGLVSWGSSQVTNAMTSAVTGSPNPVHSATGAKILDGEDDLDFALPGLLPIEWQRYYSSRDERRDGLFGASWSVSYEVCVEIGVHPEGGERLIYTDEQARQIDMGVIPLGGAVFSAGEGLSVRRHTDGHLLIESVDGRYRLFEPAPGTASRLRLNQLGDRNDNRVLLDYDIQGRLSQLRDTLDDVQIELVYSQQWPGRVEQIERLFPITAEKPSPATATILKATWPKFAMLTGTCNAASPTTAASAWPSTNCPPDLRCFYQWACVDDREWRVVRHWTDEGDDYQFDYDLHAGDNAITDGLQRLSTRRWNPQYQITGTPTTSAKPGNSNGMTSVSCSVPPIHRAANGSSATTPPATCARRQRSVGAYRVHGVAGALVAAVGGDRCRRPRLAVSIRPARQLCQRNRPAGARHTVPS